MDFDRFMGLFQRTDLDLVQVAGAYVDHIIEVHDDTLLGSVADSTYRDLLWQVAVDRADTWLLRCLICHGVVDAYFPQLFLLGDTETVQAYLDQARGSDHAALVAAALDAAEATTGDAAPVRCWEHLWHGVAVRKTRAWAELGCRTLTIVAHQCGTTPCLELVTQRVGLRAVRQHLNTTPMLATLAACADDVAFRWAWLRTLRKPVIVDAASDTGEAPQTLLSYALRNPRTMSVLAFLCDDVIGHARRAEFAQTWFEPSHLRAAVEHLFDEATMPWQDKFARFRFLYQRVVAGQGTVCCASCPAEHRIAGAATTMHIYADRILKSGPRNTGQLHQCITWLAAMDATVHEDVLPLTYPLLREQPTLLDDLLPLVDPRCRDRLVTWGLSAPYHGCTQSDSFRRFAEDHPGHPCWFTILGPLKTHATCPACHQDAATCLDHRISWWMGAGHPLNEQDLADNPLAVAMSLNIPRPLQRRFLMAGAEPALAQLIRQDTGHCTRLTDPPHPPSSPHRRSRSRSRSGPGFENVLVDIARHVGLVNEHNTYDGRSVTAVSAPLPTKSSGARHPCSGTI